MPGGEKSAYYAFTSSSVPVAVMGLTLIHLLSHPGNITIDSEQSKSIALPPRIVTLDFMVSFGENKTVAIPATGVNVADISKDARN